MYEEWSTLKKLIWIYIVKLKNKIEKLLVRGISPLSLANAVAGRIVSLIQYGKCEQDGTPTSVTPVDIKCNNGTLTMVDDELPSGYKRITSIKFDGDFWYETGKALTGQDDVTMTLDNTVSSGQNVFGSYNGTSSGTKNFSLYLYGGGSSSNCYFRYGEQLVRPRYGSGERTITFGKSGTSGFQTNVTVTPEEFTTTANAYIGMLPNSSFPAFTGSIIGNILVGTRLKYIPCERVSDSEIGYYEAVNGKFIEKTGTGVPTKGAYDTSHLNVLMVDGTPEVLTVSGANLLDPQTVPSENQFINKNTGGLTAPSASGGVWRHSEYIPVVGGETYYFHQVNATATTAGTAWYDDELTYVGGINATALGTANNKVTLPSNAAYIRHSWRIDEDYNTDWENTVYICLDGALPEFQPYATPQTASVVNLLAVGDTKDEQDIISGAVTRRCAACLYDGTQPVGNTYLSTTGGKDNGAIIVYPLAESTTEQATPQSLSTVEGTNIVSVTAEVDDIELEVIYKGE